MNDIAPNTIIQCIVEECSQGRVLVLSKKKKKKKKRRTNAIAILSLIPFW
jgi:hypothetical protein